MKQITFKSLVLLGLIFQVTACQMEKQVPESEANDNLLIGLLTGSAIESNKDFALNGVWNSFTGNGTTLDTLTTFIAKAGQKGLQLDDSSSGYSSCYIIVEFNNIEGSFITQNPQNNGACFSPDSNIGKYNKVFYFKNTAKENSFWLCTVALGVSYDAAKLQADISNRSNPGASGCGSFPFSRYDLKI